MKKISLFSAGTFLLIWGAVFIFSHNALATTNWTFDGYTNGTYMNANSGQWGYNYGDHLMVSNSQYVSSPNSITQQTGSGASNTTYTDDNNFATFQISYKQVSTNIRVWTLNFQRSDGNAINTLYFPYSATGVQLCDYGNSNCVACGTYTYNVWSTFYIQYSGNQSRCKMDSGAWSGWRNNQNTGLPKKIIFDHNSTITSSYFDNMITGTVLYPVNIGSPSAGAILIPDRTITVSGQCANSGHYLAITETPSSVSSGDFNCGCIGNAYSCSYFYTGAPGNTIYAVEDDSINWSGGVFNPANPDNYMSSVGVVKGIYITAEASQFYSDISASGFDIKILRPADKTYFPTYTFPMGTGSSTLNYFSFELDKPASVASSTVWFNITQYLNDGSLGPDGQVVNSSLASTGYGSNSLVSTNLRSTSTVDYNYVLQLTDSATSPTVIYRRYSIKLNESILLVQVNDYSASNSGILGTLSDVLRKKILFNYLFLSLDALNTFLNQSPVAMSSSSLDMTFMVQGATNGTYTTQMPVLSFSNPIIQSFCNSLRPIITAGIWLLFAVYAVWRITHLFNQS